MGNNLYSALRAVAFFCFFLPISKAQISPATDSLEVQWEQLDGPAGRIFRYAEGGGKMYAAGKDALYISSNGGRNWRYCKSYGRRKIKSIYADEHVVLAVSVLSIGTQQSEDIKYMIIDRSLDQGASWARVSSAVISELAGSGSEYVISEVLAGNDSTYTVLFSYKSLVKSFSHKRTSTNGGQNWSGQVSTNTGKDLRSMHFSDGTYSGIWRASLHGPLKGYVCNNVSFSDFQNVELPLVSSNLLVSAFHAAGGFRAFYQTNTLYSSFDNGNSYTLTELETGGNITQAWFRGEEFFVQSSTGIWRGHFSTPGQLKRVYAGEFAGGKAEAKAFCPTSSGYWLNTFGNLSVFSGDGGATWESRSTGILNGASNMFSICGKLFFQNPLTTDNIWGFNLSNAEDGEWTQHYRVASNQFFGNENLASINTTVAGGILGDWNGFTYAYGNSRIIRSNDCGISWEPMPFTANAAITGMHTDGYRLYFSSLYDFNLLYTDDNGENWSVMNTPSDGINGLFCMGDTLIVRYGAHSLYRLYISTDAGHSWEIINPVIEEPYNIRHTYQRGSMLIGTTFIQNNQIPSAVLVSHDQGRTWIAVSSTQERYITFPNNQYIQTSYPYYHDGLLFRHSNFGLQVTSDEGRHWTHLSNLPFQQIMTFHQSNGKPLHDVSADGGTAYFIDEGYLYAATQAQGIWRAELAPIRDHVLVQGGEYGIIKGRLFRDVDHSCDYALENGDLPLGHKPVILQPGNITAISDASGNYTVAVPPGQYSINTYAPLHHTAQCGTGMPVSVTASGSTEADLVFSPVPGIKDLRVLFNAPLPSRPGFDSQYKVQVSNIGTDTVSGAVLSVTFDHWLHPNMILPEGQFMGNQALMEVPEIAPGKSITFTLHFVLSADTPLGTLLHFTANCPLQNDPTPTNNRATMSPMVTGSYDPNDKLVFPVEPQPPGVPRTFDYLIRFQNIGTDTAFTVVITDKLDAQFDMMSINTLETSHDFEFRIVENRVAKWIFRNILLPDSSTNEPASHGFVRFQIATKADALPGSNIHNDADIFFDFNKPVLTNDAVAENPKWVVTNTSNVEICSGEIWNNVAWDQSTTLTDTISTVWADTISITNINVSPTWNLEESLSVPPGTELFGQTIHQDTTIIIPFSSVDGCDSTITWQISVLTSGTTLTNVAPLRLMLAPNPAPHDVVWLSQAGTGSLEPAPLRVRLFSANGQAFRQWVFPGFEASAQGVPLDLRGLPNGLYWVETMCGTQLQGLKLIKI